MDSFLAALLEPIFLYSAILVLVVGFNTFSLKFFLVQKMSVEKMKEYESFLDEQDPDIFNWLSGKGGNNNGVIGSLETFY
jgi:hypothetical protein